MGRPWSTSLLWRCPAGRPGNGYGWRGRGGMPSGWHFLGCLRNTYKPPGASLKRRATLYELTDS